MENSNYPTQDNEREWFELVESEQEQEKPQEVNLWEEFKKDYCETHALNYYYVQEWDYRNIFDY